MDNSPIISEDVLIKNPYIAYVIFHKRLVELGPNAPFPEFKPAVDFLLNKINSPKFKEILDKHPDLNFELREVKTMFAHVNLEFTFDNETEYPYSRPFVAPFPYRPTIDAIESALRLLDKLNRLEPGNKAVPLYHFDRYAYHRHSLVADQDVILFPTVVDLSFFDLIRVRSVPIGFVGIFAETLRVDRHWQSPLDFWYHDMNHVRRMHEYIKLSARKKGLHTEEDQFGFYKEMDDFIVEKIVPNIVDLPETATEEDVAIRRLVRVIIFEIFHESALTAERESIIGDILRTSGPQPFEHMISDKKEMDPKEIEKLRTPTGNLESGASIIKDDSNSAVTIRYFFDRSLGLLANVYNKLNFGFYDDPDSPSEMIVPVKYREAQFIIKATRELLSILGAEEIPTDERLMDLVMDRQGAEEKFLYKGTANKDDKDKQYATDPISAEDAINEIKSLGKKVYTLFGYSLLDYEDKEVVMNLIREELKTLNPADTLINIGATSEGIGATYEIAKELGFQTIGIVSTQALFYSGKFSDFVDRIYIVNDMNWGGYIPGTMNLAEATKAYIGVSDAISAFGGGENTAVILKLAKEFGISVKFTRAEMSHKMAKEVYGDKDVDLDGPADKVWKELNP